MISPSFPSSPVHAILTPDPVRHPVTRITSSLSAPTSSRHLVICLFTGLPNG